MINKMMIRIVDESMVISSLYFVYHLCQVRILPLLRRLFYGKGGINRPPSFPYMKAYLVVHFSDGLLQPTHTPFLIAMPQVLHGSHPQVWHMETSFIPGSSKWKPVTSPCSGRSNPCIPAQLCPWHIRTSA